MNLGKFIDFLARNTKIVFFLGLAAITGLALFIRPLVVSGDFSGFDMADNPYQQTENTLATEFHTRNLIQLKITPEKISATELYTFLHQLEDSLKSVIPGIHVVSLHKVDRLLKRLYGRNTACEKVLERCKNIPFLSNLIAIDNHSFLFLVQVSDPENFSLEVFNGIIEKNNPGILRVSPMSYFHISADIENALRRDLLLIPAVLLFIMIGLILLIFRRGSAVAYVLALVFLNLIPVFFILSVFDIPIGLGTILILPVVMVIALADSIHLLVCYLNQKDDQKRTEALRKTLRLFIVPSFLTSLTTAVAFCSFGFSESPGIRQFGLITGIVVLLEFVITFMISPYWLSRLSLSKARSVSLAKVYPFFTKNRKLLGVLLLALLISAAFLVPQLKFATHYEKFFPNRSDISKTYKEFKRDFKSPVSMDIVLGIRKSHPGDTTYAYPAIKELSELVLKIKSFEEVKMVSSAADIQAFAQQYQSLGFLLDYPAGQHPFYSKEKQLYRINIWTETSDDLYQLSEKTIALLNSYSSTFTYQIYGNLFLLDYVNESVAKSLFRSLLISSLVIILIFIALSGSFLIALVSVLANVIPLGAMVLIFVFWGLDLNILTSLICVICLGMMVDDTIHILYRKIRLKSTVGELSKSMITTSLILFGGFAIYGLSSFEPTRSFGLTCSVIFLLTMVSDLVLIPWGVELFSKNLPDE